MNEQPPTEGRALTIEQALDWCVARINLLEKAIAQALDWCVARINLLEKAIAQALDWCVTRINLLEKAIAQALDWCVARINLLEKAIAQAEGKISALTYAVDGLISIPPIAEAMHEFWTRATPDVVDQEMDGRWRKSTDYQKALHTTLAHVSRAILRSREGQSPPPQDR